MRTAHSLTRRACAPVSRFTFYSYLNANGGTSPNDAVGQAGAALLITNITDTRNAVAALDLSKTLPIGTADAGSYFNTDVLEAVDYGMANIHAWFANVSISQAAGWVNEFFQDTDVAAAQALTNKPTMYIAETGWPTVRTFFLAFVVWCGVMWPFLTGFLVLRAVG